MATNYNLSRVILLSTAAALGGFLFGFDSGVINGTVDALQLAFNSDSAGTGFNVASVLLGSMVGAFFAGTLADRFGRKPIMIATAVAFICSAWGSGISSGSLEFVIYRIIGGMAMGAASILAPAYISEIAPSKVRGRLATLQQLMIVIGLFMAFMSNYWLAGLSGGATEVLWGGFQTWRWMFWAEIIPASVFFFSLLAIPESPRYLVAAGRVDEAGQVLKGILPSINIREKVADIESTLQEGIKPKFRNIFDSYTGNIHPLIWVGLGLAILQQFTGINVIFYYGATLWKSAGFTEGDALLQNVISGSVNIFFTFVAIMLIDKVGRKPLLLVGSLGQAVMLGVMAYVFSIAPGGGPDSLTLGPTQGTIALLAANTYIAFFAFSWGPVMWVMLGEMFPNHYRGAALAVCGMAQWGANFIITISFPVLLSNLGLGISYGIYAFFGVVAYFFVNMFVDETKGLSLEDISRGGANRKQPLETNAID
ncbi:MFS transporter [Aliifodinibius salipaludis]|uniref:MFS transporter n=1 Tax=Fodinibius salipaludis TaxID=2032627 RepID=A0A2A2G8F4_9BACT|nr:sugar porter family MFS transporter [Aliifodinibius salipaludis]PAU93107.1 MFS transporter [Aliifodinibius salipaludis]